MAAKEAQFCEYIVVTWVFLWCCRVEMVKRFVNIHSHCIVSNLARSSKMLTLPPLGKISADAHVQNSLANKRDRVCDCWAVFMRKRNKGTGVLLRNNSIVDCSLVGKRLGQSPSCINRSSTKCKALCSFDWVIFVFVFTSIATEKRRMLYHWGATLRGSNSHLGGQLPQTAPPGSATVQKIFLTNSFILIFTLNFSLTDLQKLTFKPCVNLWQWFPTGSRRFTYPQNRQFHKSLIKRSLTYVQDSTCSSWGVSTAMWPIAFFYERWSTGQKNWEPLIYDYLVISETRTTSYKPKETIREIDNEQYDSHTNRCTV